MSSETPSDELHPPIDRPVAPHPNRQGQAAQGSQRPTPEVAGQVDTEPEEANRSVSRRQIARLIGSAANPVYVLDEQDVVVYVNEAMSHLGGEMAENFIGIDCSFVPESRSSNGAEFERWQKLLSPPVIWDRTSIYADPWHEEFTRLLIPLDTGAPDPKLNALKSARERSAVLVILAKGGFERLAEQIGIASRSHPNPGAWWNGESVDRQGDASPAEQHLGEIDPGDGGAAWITAGNSLKATAMRAQLLVAIQSSVSTVLVGPKSSAMEELASWIFHARIRFNHRFEKKQRLQQIDCQLLDANLLDDLFEVIEAMLSISSDEVTLQLNQIDQLPSELVLVLDRFLAGHSRLKFLSTSSCDWSQLIKRESVWERIRLRLEHLTIAVPPIGTRLEDMDAMLAAWLHRDVATDMKQLGQAKHYGAPNLAISKEAREALYAHSWPRSYEELSEVMRQARKAASGRPIEVSDFPPSVRTSLSFTSNSPAIEPLDLDSLLESVERQIIEEALLATNGNRSSAAKLLNISRARIIRRMQQWGMMPEPASRGDSATEDELDLPKFEEID